MPMPSEASRRPPPRGYALLAVMIVGALILVSAGTLAVLTRDTSRTSSQDKKNAEAHGIALTGLTWGMNELGTPAGKLLVRAAAFGTAQPIDDSGHRLHSFDPDGRYAGVPAAPPPVGQSNSNWTAYAGGHWALLGAVDSTDGDTPILRSLGVVGTTQVLLETPIYLNVLADLPAAITGCFDPDLKVTMLDRQGPYDVVGNMRIDGVTGVPFGMSKGHNVGNGLAQEQSAGVPADFSVSSEVTNRSHRGLQDLDDHVFGTQGDVLDNPGIGPSAGWAKNPFHTNDPRLVDTRTNRGLGLNDGYMFDSGVAGLLTDNVKRPVPVIALAGGPKVTGDPAATAGQSNWTNKEDPAAREGIYGCNNTASDSNDRNDEVVENCIKGSTNTAKENYTAAGVNQSGRAWGMVQSVVRQCTGSGNAIHPMTGSPFFDAHYNPNGVRCAHGFQWLENLAACLVVPADVVNETSGNGNHPDLDAAWGDSAERGDGDPSNDFQGCHPGCLLAADPDTDSDDVIGWSEHPYRSHCVNLNPDRLTAYGPGLYKNHPTIVAAGSPSWADAYTLPAARPVDPATSDPVAALGDSGWVDGTDSYVVPAGTDAWHHWNHDYDDEGYDGTSPGFAPVARNDLLFGHSMSLHASSGAPDFVTADGAHQFHGGFVVERGNPNFITRLDLTDRGPLGTCEQNCLAYGYGQDRTYGEHRTDMSNPGLAATASDKTCTAKVPKFGGGYHTSVCNMDYDGDGLMDRRSYAIASSYRESCADNHDGIPYTVMFNISSDNANIASGGCTNNLPNLKEPDTITPFCEDGSQTALLDAVGELNAIATPLTSSNINKDTDPLKEGEGWFGGAICHMGNRKFKRADGTMFDPHASGHSGHLVGLNLDDEDHLGHPDYFIEDECPDPKVWRISTNANINVGQICGCGIIIFENNSLMYKKDVHFLWRGLVIWHLKTSGGKKLEMTFPKTNGWIVEGAMLVLGEQEFKMLIDKDIPSATDPTAVDAGESVKFQFRYNRDALADAFSDLDAPLRTIRRIF